MTSVLTYASGIAVGAALVVALGWSGTDVSILVGSAFLLDVIARAAGWDV
jgi:hypothetical protein